MVASLKKGHRFELACSKWLNLVTGAVFHRVPMSGGAATSQQLESWHGDIWSEDKRYSDIVFECKSYRKAVTLPDLVNPKSDFSNWIEQVEKEAGNKFWILFFKSNNGPTFLAAPTTDVLAYAQDNSLKPVFAACKTVCQTKKHLIMQLEWPTSRPSNCCPECDVQAVMKRVIEKNRPILDALAHQ